MLEQAHKIESDEGDDIIVYDGFLTHLISDLSLSNPYYTFATRALKEMGCVRPLKRGGGRTPSQWQLIKTPTEELFTEAHPIDPVKSVMGRKQEKSVLQAQVNDLNARLAIVEEFIEGLVANADQHILPGTDSGS